MRLALLWLTCSLLVGCHHEPKQVDHHQTWEPLSSVVLIEPQRYTYLDKAGRFAQLLFQEKLEYRTALLSRKQASKVLLDFESSLTPEHRIRPFKVEDVGRGKAYERSYPCFWDETQERYKAFKTVERKLQNQPMPNELVIYLPRLRGSIADKDSEELYLGWNGLVGGFVSRETWKEAKDEERGALFRRWFAHQTPGYPVAIKDDTSVGLNKGDVSIQENIPLAEALKSALTPRPQTRWLLISKQNGDATASLHELVPNWPTSKFEPSNTQHTLSETAPLTAKADGKVLFHSLNLTELQFAGSDSTAPLSNELLGKLLSPSDSESENSSAILIVPFYEQQGKAPFRNGNYFSTLIPEPANLPLSSELRKLIQLDPPT